MRPPTALRRLTDRLPKRNDPKRFWMHVPVGVGCALVILVSAPLAVMCFVGFLAYQALEDWRIGDHSYIDVSGFNLGLFIGAGILAAVAVFTNFWEAIPL